MRTAAREPGVVRQDHRDGLKTAPQEGMMRLLYIFPRTTPDPIEREAEHLSRRETLQRAASPGTIVDIRELEGCPPAIESRRDAYAVAPAVIAMAERLEREYESMIVGWFSD